MDLNELFFRHQIALMGAYTAAKGNERDRLNLKADWLALRIGTMQARLGADAAPLARAIAA